MVSLLQCVVWCGISPSCQMHNLLESFKLSCLRIFPLTLRSHSTVDYFCQAGNDLWTKTLLLSLSNVFINFFFFATLSTKSKIVPLHLREGRHIYSQQQLTPKHSRWIISIKVRGKMGIFDFEVNCIIIIWIKRDARAQSNCLVVDKILKSNFEKMAFNLKLPQRKRWWFYTKKKESESNFKRLVVLMMIHMLIVIHV